MLLAGRSGYRLRLRSPRPLRGSHSGTPVRVCVNRLWCQAVPRLQSAKYAQSVSLAVSHQVVYVLRGTVRPGQPGCALVGLSRSEGPPMAWRTRLEQAMVVTPGCSLWLAGGLISERISPCQTKVRSMTRRTWSW
jgi:hypothetical protein